MSNDSSNAGTPDTGWQATLDDLERRRAASRAMGGPDRLARHRAKGKLDARERIDVLVDQGSFREFGTLVGGEIAADQGAELAEAPLILYLIHISEPTSPY